MHIKDGPWVGETIPKGIKNRKGLFFFLLQIWNKLSHAKLCCSMHEKEKRGQQESHCSLWWKFALLLPLEQFN